jgi:ABC-type polysaccharide/polyol phosphate transport system ATPase subunit
MTPVDVRIEHVSKQYRLGTHRRARRFWALDDVSLEIPRGSCAGIIGPNGAGKSTLLKLLSGITAPTRGRITLDGRLAALIEVGSGFHPELTGLENIFLSGAILGMRRRDIAAHLSSIVDFAGVEAFLDTPVKWYSSGMYVRLGFAIAAHLEPDILLVDEVLAVGDAEFQAKCIGRIQELKRRGVTIIFISHDLTAVEQLCDTAALFEKGRLVANGAAGDVVALYHRRLTADEAQSEAFPLAAREGVLRLISLTARDPIRPESLTGRTRNPLVITARYTLSRPLDPVVFQLSYFSADGRTLIIRTETDAAVAPIPPRGAVEFTCAELPLRPGAYCLTLVVRDAATGGVIAWWDGGTTLHVEPGLTIEGQFHVPHASRVLGPAEGSPPARAAAGDAHLSPPTGNPPPRTR